MTYTNEESKEFVVMCDCGCSSGMHFKFGYDFFGKDRNGKDVSEYYISLVHSRFYCESTKWRYTFKEKLKKIWYILRNKDYYYAEICLSPQEWEEFKKAVNKV